MKSFIWLNRIFDLFINLMMYIVCILLVFITLAILGDVFGRNWFGFSLPWVVELSSYILVYTTFFLAPWLYRDNEHIIFDVVVSRLSKRKQNTLSIVGKIIIMTILIILSYFSLFMVIDCYQRGIVFQYALSVPRWLVLLPIPISSITMIIDNFRQINRLIFEKRNNLLGSASS